MPFGLAPLTCIGLHFAMTEGPLVLATLLRRFHFEIDATQEIAEDDFATPRPRGGVPAIVDAGPKRDLALAERDQHGFTCAAFDVVTDRQDRVGQFLRRSLSDPL